MTVTSFNKQSKIPSRSSAGRNAKGVENTSFLCNGDGRSAKPQGVMELDRTDISLVAIRRILRATEIYGRRLAAASGLTPVQFRVMQIVGETGQSTPKAISQRMGVSQATMTALIDKLVRKGLVERQRSETDRRQTNILMTAKGRDTVREAPDPLQQQYVRQFEKLEDWEQAMIVAALERVATMLDASDIDASPVLDLGDIAKQA